MPRKTDMQPLCFIRSKVSSSAFEQRKNEIQSKLYRFRIIKRRWSLKRGRGTLKVSSMKRMCLIPCSCRNRNCLSILSRPEVTCLPAIDGKLQKAQENGQLRDARRNTGNEKISDSSLSKLQSTASSSR